MYVCMSKSRWSLSLEDGVRCVTAEASLVEVDVFVVRPALVEVPEIVQHPCNQRHCNSYCNNDASDRPGRQVIGSSRRRGRRGNTQCRTKEALVVHRAQPGDRVPPLGGIKALLAAGARTWPAGVCSEESSALVVPTGDVIGELGRVLVEERVEPAHGGHALLQPLGVHQGDEGSHGGGRRGGAVHRTQAAVDHHQVRVREQGHVRVTTAVCMYVCICMLLATTVGAMI